VKIEIERKKRKGENEMKNKVDGSE